jgi:hypothetical protein
MATSFIPVPTLMFSGAVLLGGFQLLVMVAALRLIRKTNRERRQFDRNVTDTLQQMEVVMMRDRNQLASHYDNMLESLSSRLPSVISTRAGDAVFEIEKQVLAKLAAVHPNLDIDDEEVDNLIRTMERLEDSVIAATGDVVRETILESRKGIFADRLSGQELGTRETKKFGPEEGAPQLVQKVSKGS